MRARDHESGQWHARGPVTKREGRSERKRGKGKGERVGGPGAEEGAGRRRVGRRAAPSRPARRSCASRSLQPFASATAQSLRAPVSDPPPPRPPNPPLLSPLASRPLSLAAPPLAAPPLRLRFPPCPRISSTPPSRLWRLVPGFCASPVSLVCACQACRHRPWHPGVEVPAFPPRLPPSLLSGLFSHVVWRGRFPLWLLLSHRFPNSGFGGAGARCTCGGAPWTFFALLVRAVRVIWVREFLAQQIFSGVSCSLSLFFSFCGICASV